MDNLFTDTSYPKTTFRRLWKMRGVVDDVRTIIQGQKEYIYIPDLRPKTDFPSDL